MEVTIRRVQVIVCHLYLCTTLSAVDCHSYASIIQDLQKVVTFVVDPQVRACVVVLWCGAIRVSCLSIMVAVT